VTISKRLTAIAIGELNEAEFVAQVLHMLAALTPTLVAQSTFLIPATTSATTYKCQVKIAE
jgi:hypothetical protein